MSTEVIIFGLSVSKSIIFCLSGLLGGFFPFCHDLLTRQKMPPQQKIDLDKEFFLIKALLIPLLAFLVTILAVAFDSITTWIAAVYFGASLPVLVEKTISSSSKTVSNLGAGQ